MSKKKRIPKTDRKELSLRDRIFIEQSLKSKMKIKDIADILGFSYSAIYKEIKRGLCLQFNPKKIKDEYVYLSDFAQKYHDEHVCNRGVKLKLSANSSYLHNVNQLLWDEKYSLYCAMQTLDENELCLRSLYNYLNRGFFDNNNGVCYKRRKKKEEKKEQKRYPKGMSIEKRPREVLDRETECHWEMDTVYSGKDGSACLLVLTERKWRLEIVRKIKDRKADSVVNELNNLERQLGYEKFTQLFKTITCDNGVEFMDYTGIEQSVIFPEKKRTDLYYAHAYSSCERGSNENANKLIRRWIPKGDDISLYSTNEIQHIEKWINSLPRKLFNGHSAYDSCSVYLRNLYRQAIQ